MFEYFPTNYIWSLGVAATLNSGGAIDEVDRACRPIREAAERGDAGTRDLMLAWKRVADQVADQAAEAEKAGHLRTAGQKYFRASAYVCQAERMLSSQDPERIPFYQQGLDLMQKSFELIDPATTRVEVPFEGDLLAAYFTNAERADGTPAPTMIMWNGLDSTKEHMDQAVNSPKRELRVFTPEEGATEHVGLDHLPHVGAFTADWIEDTFAEMA